MLDVPAIRTADAHERRAAMVDAINKALEIFCSHRELTFEEVMGKALCPIADVMDVDRISVYQHVEKENERYLKQLFHWDKTEGGLTRNGTDVLPDSPTITKWLGILLQDVCLNMRLCDMSEDEVALMDSYGVKSVLLVPFVTRGELWGGIVFQDRRNERLFDEDCMDLIRSAARMCVNAIMLTFLEKEVADKNALHQAMFSAAPVGLTIFDENLEFIDCNDAVLAMYGITKEYYKDHLFELSPELQPDGSNSREKLFKNLRRTLEGEKIVLEWVHLSPAGESIPCEITLTRTMSNGKHIGLGYVYDLRNMKKMERAVADAEGLTRAITEASHISYILFNENLRAVECNNATLQIFACPDKQYFLDHYWDLFSPVYQPDGQKSSDKAAVLKKYAVDYGQAVSEWAHRTLNGEPLPMENTLAPIMYKGEKYFISHKHDLRNIRKMEESIRSLESKAEKIFYDPLTGIYNRRFFDENLIHIIKSLSRSGGTLSLMMIDIDFFKRYNDTYGHSEGDNCLKTVATTLSSSITRTDDFVARYGGEEFAVVLPNTNEKGACKIAEKLLKNIRACNIPHAENDAANCVTVSIGVTTGDVSHTQHEEDYIKRADELLYKSKQNGRNRYTFEKFD